MIETKHPAGKRGIQIPEKIYENIASFIVQAIGRDDRPNLLSLLQQAEIAFPALNNLNLLVYHVKLDLEARGFIRTQFFKNQRTQILRLKRRRRIY